jgi:hypothetical protein
VSARLLYTFFIVTIQLLALFLATKFRRNIINCHLVGHYQLQKFCTSASGRANMVVYICSSLLRLALESRDLSQAEKIHKMTQKIV